MTENELEVVSEEIAKGAEIIVDEKYDSSLNTVKDYSVELNTGQSMKAEINTGKINGCLKAIIISTTSPIQINISVARLPIFPFEKTAFVILEDVNFSGDAYVPVGLNPLTLVNGRMDRMNFTSTEWYLNDKLRVFVKGARNTTVNVTFRYM